MSHYHQFTTLEYQKNLKLSQLTLCLWFLMNTCYRISLVAPGGRHTLMLTDTGEVFTCGSNDFGQLGREGSQTRLEQVMCDVYYY